MNLLINKIYETFEANTAAFAALNLEPVKTLDLYRGQPLNPEGFEFFETPALFLDYRLSWERRGNYYAAEGTLDVHVVIDNPFETGNIYTGREEALKKVFWHQIARGILDNLESQHTSKLIRVEERPVDTGVICYHILPYRFSYTDPNVIGGDRLMIDDVEIILNKQLVKQL